MENYGPWDFYTQSYDRGLKSSEMVAQMMRQRNEEIRQRLLQEQQAALLPLKMAEQRQALDVQRQALQAQGQRLPLELEQLRQATEAHRQQAATQQQAAGFAAQQEPLELEGIRQKLEAQQAEEARKQAADAEINRRMNMLAPPAAMPVGSAMEGPLPEGNGDAVAQAMKAREAYFKDPAHAQEPPPGPAMPYSGGAEAYKVQAGVANRMSAEDHFRLQAQKDSALNARQRIAQIGAQIKSLDADLAETREQAAKVLADPEKAKRVYGTYRELQERRKALLGEIEANRAIATGYIAPGVIPGLPGMPEAGAGGAGAPAPAGAGAGEPLPGEEQSLFPAQPVQQVAKPKTRAEKDALPAGTRYLGPDGKIATKK